MNQLVQVSLFSWCFLVLLSFGCASLVSHFLVYLLSFLSFLRFLFLVVYAQFLLLCLPHFKGLEEHEGKEKESSDTGLKIPDFTAVREKNFEKQPEDARTYG